MFAKLCVLILGGGACAAGLLSLRQQRLDAVHEMIVLQGRMTALDRDLLTLRTRIASLVTPGRVERMALSLGPLRPLGVSTGEQDVAAESPRPGQRGPAAPRARAQRGVTRDVGRGPGAVASGLGGDQEPAR